MNAEQADMIKKLVMQMCDAAEKVGRNYGKGNAIRPKADEFFDLSTAFDSLVDSLIVRED